MADIDEVNNALAYKISEMIKPYQPDCRPQFPNDGPLAGQIPPTLTAAGYPIQPHVMKRLENHLAQVAVFDLKAGAVFPFYNRFADINNLAKTGVPEVGTESFDVTREKKQVAVQCWCSTIKELKFLSQLVRTKIGDAYRIHHEDGSLTLFKFLKTESEYFEQMDSVYVRTYLYEADFTIILPTEAARIVYPTLNPLNSGPIPQPPLTVDTL